MTEKLPVEDVLDQLADELASQDEAILQAPPGAGKTTLVPLKFLHKTDGKIIMLEPRRIAARNAAFRMAHLLNEEVGETVGYRMRLDSRISPRTRIEVVTEGVLLRMLQNDPSLDGIDMLIFDEFHERNLDADFALALALKSRELFRDKPLKILLMSATLDQQKLQALFPRQPIQSEGQTFPVDIQFGSTTKPGQRIVPQLFELTRSVAKQHPDSSILIFLPGEGEIRQLEQLLQESVTTHIVRPLFGNLSIEAQVDAIQPAPGQPKIVLATNIAESSLTIEGVNVVIDSGLERRAQFEPNSGMTRLQTVRISQASATQRAGRAGRLAPGHCYRLWTKDQHQQLATQSKAEIFNADLADLTLQLLAFGFDSPRELDWVDEPPQAHWQQALDQLKSFNAVADDTPLRLTAHGEQMATLSLPPRLSHMLIDAKRWGATELGSALAALWSDRDPLGRDEQFGINLELKLDVLLGQRECPGRHRGWLHRTRNLMNQFAKQIESVSGTASAELAEQDQLAVLVASAFPDRVARKRHGGGYQLSNGRSARLPEETKTYLSKAKWLAVSEVTGSNQGNDIIRNAAELNAKLFDGPLAHLKRSQRIADWDKKSARFVAEQQTKIGELVLKRETLTDLTEAERVTTLCGYIATQGLQIFKQYQAFTTLQKRCAIAFDVTGDPTYEFAESHLMARLENWLGPYLSGQTKLESIRKIDIVTILLDQMSYEQKQQLGQLAPTTLEVPSGSKIKIDYSENPPVLAVKLQEMFGCDETPRIGGGKINLAVHLLSPAGRPLQITQDLHGFWRSSYQAVRKDMRGRYPKHAWPEDPTVATATRHTKNRA